MRCQNDKGVALALVVVVMIMLGLIATYATQLGYNQRRLTESMGGKRAKIYYRAQAGVVNAQWRIRTDYTAGLAPAGNFTTDAYDPGAYQLDVDGNGTNDCTVDIGPVTNAATKQRAILSTGIDN